MKLRIVYIVLICIAISFNCVAKLDISEIKEKTNYILHEPCAVKYKIVNNNYVSKMTYDYKKANGKDPGVRVDFYLVGDCLWISNGKGGERFEFTRAEEHFFETGSEITTRTISIERVSDYCIKRVSRPDGSWASTVYLTNDGKDGYLRSGGFAQWGKYPFFGMAVPNGEHPPYSMETIGDFLVDYGVNETEDLTGKENYIKEKYGDKSIQWGKNAPLPDNIRYISTGANDIYYEIIVEETGVVNGKYLYPKKASMSEYAFGELWERSEIKVLDIIVGDEALKKYPLHLPDPKVARFIDERKLN